MQKVWFKEKRRVDEASYVELAPGRQATLSSLSTTRLRDIAASLTS
jgi:hypothetical protein